MERMELIIDLTKPGPLLVLLKSETSSLTKAPPGTKPTDQNAKEPNNTEIITPTATTCLYCSLPASKKCGKCHQVMFCGVEHQKLMWSYHKHRCNKDSSKFVQAPLTRQETDEFAKTRVVSEILRACADTLHMASSTVVHDRSPLNRVVLFPESFYGRLPAPQFRNLLLIEALARLSPSGTSPLDYFWKICCYHGEDILPVSQEALDWRCHFRRLRMVTIDRDINDTEVFYSFRAVAAFQIKLRIHRVTFPDEVQDRLLDALYYHAAIDTVISETPWDGTYEHRREMTRIKRGAYDRLAEAYQNMYGYEWKTERDGLFVSWLALQVSRLWLPSTFSLSAVQECELEKGRDRVYEEWDKKIIAKFLQVSDMVYEHP